MSKNKYWLPHNIYKMLTYMVRSYYELLERREEILNSSPKPADGMPRGSGVSDPTADKATRLAVVDSQIHAISQVMCEMRNKYYNTCTGEPFEPLEAFNYYSVFCYYRSKPNKDEAPSRSTWYRYRSEFTYLLAAKLNFY